MRGARSEYELGDPCSDGNTADALTREQADVIVSPNLGKVDVALMSEREKGLENRFTAVLDVRNSHTFVFSQTSWELSAVWLHILDAKSGPLL